MASIKRNNGCDLDTAVVLTNAWLCLMLVQAADQDNITLPHFTYSLLHQVQLGDELSCCVAAMTVCPIRCSGCHKSVKKTSTCCDGYMVMGVKESVVVVVVEKVMVVVVLLILGQDMVVLAQSMWWW